MSDNNTTPELDGVKITADTLKSGEVLAALILRFLNNRTKENLVSVLSCLRDSKVWLPADMEVDKAVIPLDESGDVPVILPTKQNVSVTPYTYKAKDGNYYMPIYSRRENVRKENVRDGCALLNIPYTECVKMLDQNESCSRFVLDPHLYNVVLTENMIDITKQMPSRLSQ